MQYSHDTFKRVQHNYQLSQLFYWNELTSLFLGDYDDAYSHYTGTCSHTPYGLKYFTYYYVKN